MSVCARSGCDQIGTKACAACLKEYYCTGQCQKEDWKVHKVMCNMIQQMPDTLQPFRDVCLVVERVLDQTEEQKAKLGRTKYIRLLEHTATFAEHQFGKRIAGKRAYERNNGDKISNWEVEINILFRICARHCQHFLTYETNVDNRKECWMYAVPYLQKLVAILEPWIIHIGLSERERSDILDEGMIHYLFDLISETEDNLSRGYYILDDSDKAQHHCEQAIYHAKQMKEGEKKIKRVTDSLRFQGLLYIQIGKFIEAKAVMEETYILLSEIYDPEHPLVLKVAGRLIEILGQTGDYYDAERFARICYEALIRPPLDPESFEAAQATINLSHASIDVIEANGSESADIEEAEMLARESIRIIKNLDCFYVEAYKWSFSVLVKILFFKKDFGEETKALLEDYLNDTVRHQGIDGIHTGDANKFLGRFYLSIAYTTSDDLKIAHLQHSYSHFQETSRIYMKNYGPNHPLTLEAISILSEFQEIRCLQPSEEL